MFCTKCGKPISDNDTLCNDCKPKPASAPAPTRYKMVFERNGNDVEFIESINYWFSTNPKVANVTCKFELGVSLGILSNKSRLKKLEIEYELFKKDNPNKYYLIKETSFGLMKNHSGDIVKKWKAENPQVKVVSWEGCIHSRGSRSSLLLGCIGAANHTSVYMFCKSPR